MASRFVPPPDTRTASERIRAARIAGEEELAARLEAQRREQIRRERIAAQERARQALAQGKAVA